MSGGCCSRRRLREKSRGRANADVLITRCQILFLENLWWEACEKETDYRREVRTTFLHELGHYLGLEEIDLEERGL